MNLIDKHGGYRTLDSFTLARIIELGTWRFCEKFLNRKNDPCGRLFDKFSKWLESDDPDVVANAMLILLRRVIKMLNRQIAKQGDIFRDEGGFHERMTSVRLEEREKQQVEAGVPECPECGKLMRRRTARSGPNAGSPFWGCTGYPECKGTRKVEE